MGVRQTGLNNLQLECRLATEPKLTHTPAGLAICKFRIAIPRRKKVDGEWQDNAFFMTVVLFGKAAERWPFADLYKGAPVLIQGKLDQTEWVDEDGKAHSDSDITAWSVKLQEWPGDKDNNKQDDEDIPF